MYKHNGIFAFCCLLGLQLFLAGCREKNSLPHPDISGIEVEVDLLRMESFLARADSTNYHNLFLDWEYKHPSFFKLYTSDILQMRSSGNPGYDLYDTLFTYMVADEYMARLQDSVQAAFPDLEETEEAIELALRYYKYYFPEKAIPAMYTYMAPFVYQVVVTDSLLGIELDLFMGEQFTYYSNLSANMPQYMLYRFDKAFIPISVMRALMDGETGSTMPDANLLDDMIAEGKMMYYLDLVMPDVPDSIKMGYTTGQLEWCRQNAEEIWKFFAGEELFFSTKQQDKQRYIGEAPFSYGMPEESPGRVGIWLGWQIVRAFMERNPDTDPRTLFSIQDGMYILEESNYEP